MEKPLTEKMKRVLEIAGNNGFIYAGHQEDPDRRGALLRVAASTLRGLAHRKLLTLSINPDGGMMGELTPDGIALYHALTPPPSERTWRP